VPWCGLGLEEIIRGTVGHQGQQGDAQRGGELHGSPMVTSRLPDSMLEMALLAI
jgi:hypothetical protein